MINPFLNNETDFDGKGQIVTVTKNTTTDIDLLIPEARLINGGLIYADKGVAGDTITCQVVDKDGIYAPAGTVLNQWLTNWPIVPTEYVDLITEQTGELPAGIYLRMKYTSTGTVDDVKVLIGYRLYKVIG